MKQYTFPLGLTQFNEQQLITGMDFQPAYVLQKPLFSSTQYLFTPTQQLIATLQHKSLSQKTAIIYPDRGWGLLQDNFISKKELMLQRNEFSGEQIILKQGQIIGRASYQNFRCIVEVHDEAYTEEVVLLSVINDYHYGIRILFFLFILLVAFNIIF